MQPPHIVAKALDHSASTVLSFLDNFEDGNATWKQCATKRSRLEELENNEKPASWMDSGDFVTVAQSEIVIVFDCTKPCPDTSLCKKFEMPKLVVIESICKANNHNDIDQTQNTTRYEITFGLPGSIQTLRLNLISEDLHLVWKDVFLGARLNKHANSKRYAGQPPPFSSLFYVSCPDAVKGSVLKLRTKLFVKNAQSLTDCTAELNGELVRQYLPLDLPTVAGTWSPQLFYDCVHTPPKDEIVSPAIQDAQLACQLYPFQRRAVNWLLRRECVQIDDSGEIIPQEQSQEEIPPSFFPTTDAADRPCYASKLLGSATSDLGSLRGINSHIRGGILAEEMGLGKTAEIIALICLNKRKMQEIGPIYDSYSGQMVRPSPATLVITPPAILEQWRTEIVAHAPNLKIFHYEGVRKSGAKLEDRELIDVLLRQDVVLTTYSVLAGEIHYAKSAPGRILRNEKKYQPRKSPLVQISWWRVCLDEAQMVESGVSNAATVAKLIPRCNAWAVSGTPVRKDVKDLLGLLIFLRYEPFCYSSSLWNRLVGGKLSNGRLSSRHRPGYTWPKLPMTDFMNSFKAIFGQISLRHSKEYVREELRLPRQNRIVITVPFTQIEEQHYTQLYHNMCEDVGLDRQGGPLNDSWDPESSATVAKMRRWLVSLRQTCLHAGVAPPNRRALGHNDGPLRTVDEVLQVMIDQNDLAIRTEERTLMMSQILRGQMLEEAKRTQNALDIWLPARERAHAIVAENRVLLENAIKGVAECNEHSAEKAKLTNGESSSDSDDGEGAAGSRGLVSTCRNRLRGALEVEHVCTFFAANGFFQLKTNTDLTKPDSEQFSELEKLEGEYYEKAKMIRREILKDVHRKADRSMRMLRRKDQDHSFVQIPDIEESLDLGGLENQKIIENLDMLGSCLNKQANLLDEWRDQMIRLLLQPLVDEDEGDDLQGDEYEVSTKHQEQVVAYMTAIRAAVADRNDAITGQDNILIKEEMKSAMRSAKDGEGPLPKLMQELLTKRAYLKPEEELGSLRGIVAGLRGLASTLRWQAEGGSSRASTELAIVEKHLQHLHRISNEQTKAASGLEKEVEIYRTAMNARVEFYRQLQHISDTVAPYENEGRLDEEELAKMLAAEAKLADKLASLKSTSRYLMYLRKESVDPSSQRICVICRGDFELGALTVCGHQYCKECLDLWWRQHRTCPVCKKHLRKNDIHDIVYKPQELQVQEEDTANSFSSKQNSAFYKDISKSTLSQIKNIDLNGSFGTKIDSIARHILWIRANDPGAKSIIFSQYKVFLLFLHDAFKKFRIGHTSIDTKNGIESFKQDPAIECFLLHARAHSSGLNLVNATHVFLCEPLINTAIELQAIARVHRIGQHQETTIWMYLVKDTVEESIYELSVSRRLAHMSSASLLSREGHSADTGADASGTGTPLLQESTIDVANSLELQSAPLEKLMMKESMGGGELVSEEDLWGCLFGKRAGHKRKIDEAIGADAELARNVRARAAEDRIVFDPT
ncbi:MAG: hypothetical protein M1819_002280 [Sarea resinae]|nr:MAG: hypothetical protein M1819_002280 [Sarea resinae]